MYGRFKSGRVRASGPLALQRRCHIIIFRADAKNTIFFARRKTIRK
jgi:hypothetical protein